MKHTIYDYTFTTSRGEIHPMSDFQGKVILIVNTATKCGLAPQFAELEELHERYKDQGLVVLGFPCDQFMNQEPESDETMGAVCQRNFGVTFPLSRKIQVNGTHTDPLFVFLKESLHRWYLGKDIKWNFTKFLVTKEGIPYKRYAPTVPPLQMEDDIVLLLSKSA